MPENLRLNATHHFVMKIANKTEFQKVALKHLPNTEFNGFMKLYKKDCTKELFSFLVTDATVPSDKPLRFRKNLIKNDC